MRIAASNNLKSFPGTIRIFVAARGGQTPNYLVEIFKMDEKLVLCGASGFDAAASARIERLAPNIVLVDLCRASKSGLAFLKRNAKKNHFRVLAVSDKNEPRFANQALTRGADGYVWVKEPPGEIAFAIRDVMAGLLYVSESVLGSPSQARPNRRKTSVPTCLRNVEAAVPIPCERASRPPNARPRRSGVPRPRTSRLQNPEKILF